MATVNKRDEEATGSAGKDKTAVVSATKGPTRTSPNMEADAPSRLSQYGYAGCHLSMGSFKRCTELVYNVPRRSPLWASTHFSDRCLGRAQRTDGHAKPLYRPEP